MTESHRSPSRAPSRRAMSRAVEPSKSGCFASVGLANLNDGARIPRPRSYKKNKDEKGADTITFDASLLG